MTCDLCGKNEATVHLTEIIDDQTRELHLCEGCAQEKGASAAQEFGLADLLAGLTDIGSKLGGKRVPGEEPVACAQCGMTYEGFRKSGRLGCAGCYQTFRSTLAPLLKKIHGSAHHVGRIPAARGKKTEQAVNPLKELRARLKEAIAAEAFEEAAQLRDQIRALEGTKGTRGPERGMRKGETKRPSS